MAEATINSIDDLINDQRFTSLSLPDKNKMLMTFPEFAQHKPQDRQKMLDIIHYQSPNPNQPVPGVFSGGGAMAPGESLPHAVTRQGIAGPGRAVESLAELPKMAWEVAKQPFGPRAKTPQEGGFVQAGPDSPLELAHPSKPLPGYSQEFFDALIKRAKAGDIGAITEAATYAFGPEAVGKMSKATLAKIPLDDLARRMYQRALKPSPATHTLPEVQTMTTEAIESGIPISEKGVVKLRGLIDDLNRKITDKIKDERYTPIIKRTGSSREAMVDPQAVAKRTGPTRAKFMNQVNPESDVAAIDASTKEFLKKQGAKPGKPAVPPQPTGLLDAQGKSIMTSGTPATAATPSLPMSAEEAQNVKVGTYRQLRGKYGELDSAAVESQKALARGIKEELETKFPEIHDLNAEESRKIGLDEALERAVKRIGNRNFVSLTGAIAGGTLGVGTAAMTGSSAEGAAMAAVTATIYQVIADPVVQSKLAIALNRASKGLRSTSVANARVAGYLAALKANPPAQPKGGSLPPVPQPRSGQQSTTP
jgi:hypothetical protein